MAAATYSGSVDDFVEQGDLLTVASTVGGGILGGVFSYRLYKAQLRTVSQTGVTKEAEETYDYVINHNGSPAMALKEEEGLRMTEDVGDKYFQERRNTENMIFTLMFPG